MPGKRASQLRGPEGREWVSCEREQDGDGARAPAPRSSSPKPLLHPRVSSVPFRRVYGLYQMYRGIGNVLTSGRDLSLLLWVTSTTSEERKPEEARLYMCCRVGTSCQAFAFPEIYI